jgi:cytochrome c553
MLPLLFQTCVACHGANGVSTLPLTPSLAGQPAFYVTAQLAQFVAGKRKSDVMAPMAKTIAAKDVRELAEAIEKLPPPPPAPDIDASRYERGKGLVAREHCDSCHQPDFSGIENAPRLAHQREDYLRKALLDYKEGARLGYGEPVMPGVAAALSEAEIGDLAHYLAHFKSQP